MPASFDTHSAVSNPGTLTNGVVTLCSGVTHGFGAAADDAMKRPFDKYACSWPLPPPSAAGFTHAAAMFSPCALPKREFAGGGTLSRKLAYATAQPICDADLQSGMFWNAPTSLPFSTGRFVPSSSAETIFSCTGLPSISLRISCVSTPEPCEWPTSTTPRPALSFLR